MVGNVRNLASDKKLESPDLNRPIKFVGSQAHAFKSQEGRSGAGAFEDAPWYQMYSVVFSTAIFLFYFCVLREESDVDLELEKNLYDRVPGLEETQLVINYKYNIANSQDNSKIVARMKELGMKEEDIKF